jgi:chromosome segregation ATPase
LRRELDRKLQITSTDAKEERQLIKEMTFIKESRPYILEIEELKALIHQKKNEKYEVGKGLQDLKAEQNDLRKRIDAIKKTQDEVTENRESVQKALDKINADRNALRA